MNKLATKKYSTPSIYVASLAAYNNGKIHGTWIELEGKDHFDVQDEIDEMLSSCPEGTEDSPSEEWAIHCSKCLPVEEHSDIERLCELTNIVTEHGAAGSAYIDLVGSRYATLDGFNDSFVGLASSPEDYAYKFYEECGALKDVPDNVKFYIDWSSVARDMELRFIDTGGEDCIFTPGY